MKLTKDVKDSNKEIGGGVREDSLFTLYSNKWVEGGGGGVREEGDNHVDVK